MSRNRSHLYTATSCPWSSTSSLSLHVKSGPEAEAADFRPCLRGRWSKSGVSKVWKSQWKGLEHSPTRVLADCFWLLLCCSTELPRDPAQERPRTTRTGSAVFQNLVASGCRDLRFTYFCHVTNIAIILLEFFPQPSKNVKTILSLQALQKQMAGCLWPAGPGLPPRFKGPLTNIGSPGS